MSGFGRRDVSTIALDVHTLVLSELPTLLALRDRPTFPLDLKQGAISVMTSRGAMAFDARCAIDSVS